MLRIRNLEAGYGALRVLKGLSLHVRPGEVVTIIGANGAGKSTLLGAVAGVVRAPSGTVQLDKQDVRGAPPEKIVRLGCRLVPEGRHVFSTLTVHENLVLGAYCDARGLPAGELDEQAILDKHKIKRNTFNRWLADENFEAELVRRIKTARLMSDVLIAKYSVVAAAKLVGLTESEKEETARKACLDIISLPNSKLPEQPDSEETETVTLSDETASKILAVLAEEKDGN